MWITYCNHVKHEYKSIQSFQQVIGMQRVLTYHIQKSDKLEIDVLNNFIFI